MNETDDRIASIAVVGDSMYLGKRIPPASAPSRVDVEFEPEDLLERLSGDRQLARRVLGRFLSDTPQQLAVLAQAVHDGDGQATSQIAHAIKGAAANVGGKQVRELAWKLEQIGKTGDFNPAAGIIEELLASYDRTSVSMEQFCQAPED